MVTLRNAASKDAKAIRQLIWLVQINPFNLDWRHFLVAVDEHDNVIATGQIKPHKDGTRELASIATRPEWRSQGISSAIIQRLLAENPPPLYLTCQGRMRPFYERFGFRSLTLAEMPPDLGRMARPISWLKRHVFPTLPDMLIMKR